MGTSRKGALHGAGGSVALAELETASCLGTERETFRGRSVLLALREQMSTALALLELDGIARRLVLCTPDLNAQRLAEVAASAHTDITLTDGSVELAGTHGPVERLQLRPAPVSIERREATVSEWILLTSGTTGAPKLVAHSLASLAGFLPRQPPEPDSVWSTFYDIRRYGGLQIYLRAMLSGCPLVLSSPAEATEDFLARAGAQGVTHISGTPSHWRRALMSGAAGRLKPRYVRLSGEVADQVVLDQLRATFPGARIGHAFASTEAGVAFEVDDGLAGFPADFLNGSAARRRHESRGRHAAHPLAADRGAAISAPHPPGSRGRMAMWTRAISSSCKAAAIIFAAARAASSMWAAKKSTPKRSSPC